MTAQPIRKLRIEGEDLYSLRVTDAETGAPVHVRRIEVLPIEWARGRDPRVIVRIDMPADLAITAEVRESGTRQGRDS